MLDLALRILSAHEDADWSALSEIATNGVGMDALNGLARSWLAQRDVVAAALALLDEADKHREDVWCGDYDRARDTLRAAVAAVVSGPRED
jgi:hypothetical protein